MDGKTYQELAARTINDKLTETQASLHALHGMVSEVGEIHDVYQKLYQGHLDIDKSEKHLQKEVGDLLWFIAEYCTVCGWSLDDIMQLNIEKLTIRYPNGFEEEKSKHRQEGDI